MASITVVVADDDAPMRQALTSMLLTDPRFDVVGQAATGPELLEAVALSRPDVALVDLRMPGGGPDLVAVLVEGLRHGPQLAPVVVSSDTSPSTVATLLRAGARGYLAKGRIGTSLPDLVARCAHGEVVIATPTGAEALRQLMSAQVR